jgi:hypothetical protein
LTSLPVLLKPSDVALLVVLFNLTQPLHGFGLITEFARVVLGDDGL